MSNISQVCNLLLEQLYLIRTVPQCDRGAVYFTSRLPQQQAADASDTEQALGKYVRIPPPVQLPCFKQPEVWAHPQTKI